MYYQRTYYDMLIIFVIAQNIFQDRKLCNLRLSGIILSSYNAQAFCKDNLSHTKGLNLVRGHVEWVLRYTGSTTASQGAAIALTLRSKLERLTVSSSFSLRFLF